MANDDRYETRTRDRGYTSDYDRSDRDNGRGSIFNFGRDDRDRDSDNGWRTSRSDRSDDRSIYQARRGYDRDEGRSRSRYGRDDDAYRDRDRFYGPDDTRDSLARDETSHLIASNKVEGTTVYGRNGERLGSIYNFMVDKKRGKVEYAVMSYGGFLGMGTRYYPIPWKMLDYNTREGGYHVDMSERDLENAPSFNRDNEPQYDRNYSGRVHDYYGINY